MSITNPYEFLPPLTDDEYAALKESILQHGILVPLEFDEDENLLDGHHRREIVEELRAEGVKIDYMTVVRPGLSEDEKRAHVRALNLVRRHLSHAQRRELIEGQLKDTPDKSDSQIARMLGVSDKTVAAIRRRLEEQLVIPRFAGRACSDGRTYPARIGGRSVIAKNRRETERALAALADTPLEALPNSAVDVKRLERIRRESRIPRAATEASWHVVESCVQIHLGDFRDTLSDLPDGGVDLVLTDPPYSREFLSLWDDLGRFAARVLRPGGLLVSYTGQDSLPTVLANLSNHLAYVWTLSQVGRARKMSNHNKHVRSCWKPLVVYARAPYQPGRWWDDVLTGDGPDKRHHRWQQSEGEARQLVEAFSEPGDLVVDPCVGSGTTGVASLALGRRFIGCDIDPAAVATSRERVRAVIEQSHP